MSLINKVVIVTGASSGIGAAAALLFAKEGADVALVARNAAKLAAVAKQIEALGKKPLVIRADISNETEASTVVSKTVEHFGKLDVLVNNAGIEVQGTILNGDALEAFDKVMKLNVRAVIQLTTLAAPFLAKTKGNIVNVSSIASILTSKYPTGLPYYVSKAALDHFTRCAALELASIGVRVNSVNPGPVDNEFPTNNNLGDASVINQERAKIAPLGFLAKSEEIADVILFLASEKARSVTGSSYFIDNGFVLKG
ncbi:3-oxoacyl-[acyl-carrier-protein] reductase FabG-like [Cydia fagiglandana]|uniref:3-oxoacyl-[acyl-carrier-protein] reductase FabG-like n=1 Tax=Cydia fagiglandana TaxID=1458189 RepID=UPI002FEE1E26